MQITKNELLNLGGKALGLNILLSMGYYVPDFIVVQHMENLDSSETQEKINSFVDKYDNFAVRSSANLEDSEKSSFAGQFISFLNVNKDNIFNSVIEVRNSSLNENVSSYLKGLNLEDEKICMNVIIQEFKEPEISGVWMGNGLKGGRIEWAYGRGDLVVNGQVSPFYENYDNSQLVETNSNEILKDSSNTSISEYCLKIQNEIGYDADIEFCLVENKVHWLQLRKVTRKILNSNTTNEIITTNPEIIKGEAASPFVATGVSYRLDQHFGENFDTNKILVARATSPNDMLFIINSDGVVTKMGGMLSHAAVVCRELGKACVVGVDIDKIPHNRKIIVNGQKGEVKILNELGPTS